tara:strand:- start:15048 stop:15359 length:312 start_codon:yes stop_codon:yes gene_type:complete
MNEDNEALYNKGYKIGTEAVCVAYREGYKKGGSPYALMGMLASIINTMFLMAKNTEQAVTTIDEAVTFAIKNVPTNCDLPKMMEEIEADSEFFSSDNDFGKPH